MGFEDWCCLIEALALYVNIVLFDAVYFDVVIYFFFCYFDRAQKIADNFFRLVCLLRLYYRALFQYNIGIQVFFVLFHCYSYCFEAMCLNSKETIFLAV